MLSKSSIDENNPYIGTFDGKAWREGAEWAKEQMKLALQEELKKVSDTVNWGTESKANYERTREIVINIINKLKL